MRAPIFFPSLDIGYKHACANDVFEGRTGLLQSAFDVANDLNRLPICIADTDQFTFFIDSCRAGQIDAAAYTDGAAIADNILPLRSGRDVLAITRHLFR
jgi:hypothetical protein